MYQVNYGIVRLPCISKKAQTPFRVCSICVLVRFVRLFYLCMKSTVCRKLEKVRTCLRALMKKRFLAENTYFILTDRNTPAHNASASHILIP